MMNDTDIRWIVLDLHQLTAQQAHDVFKLRVDVFVVEQRCAYAEIDGQDPAALHVLGYADDRLVAYARVLPPHAGGLPHIGRVVTDGSVRGQGLGRKVMLRAIEAVQQRYGSRANALAAQAHLQGFYEGLGYARTSPEPYDWDGIPHVDMVLSAGA